jgi:hypothetical protein
MKFLLIIVSLNIVVFSQQQVNRTSIPNTLSQKYDSTSTLFPISAFWGEMQKGFESAGESMNSNIRFGGLFSFYRWENTALDFTLSFELTADPYNDIAFNPRSARWQEELFLASNTSYGVISYGLMHRCKHEIDNFDPDDASTQNNTFRVLLTTGPFVSFQNKIEENNWLLSYFARGDWTIMKGDYRYEDNNQSPDWENLIGEISGGFLFEFKTFKYANLYSRNWINMLLFQESAEFNYRSELGFVFQQKKNKMSTYIAYEHLFDDLMLNIPRNSNVIYIGFRGSHDLFW